MFFKLKIHQNPFSAGASPPTPLGELTTLRQTTSRLGRGHNLGASPIPPYEFLPTPLNVVAQTVSWFISSSCEFPIVYVSKIVKIGWQ